MEGRLPGTAGGAKARAYILRRYKEAGIQPIGESFERPFSFGGRRTATDQNGVNIVGVVRGRRAPDRYIVISAHFDHLGVRDGQIFNGADDNASGVAALLAVAARLSANPPEHSMVSGSARRRRKRAERLAGLPQGPAGCARRDRDERQPGHGRARREERAVRRQAPHTIRFSRHT